MCCWSSAKITEKFCELLEDSILDRFLVEVVVSVLVGTRHKGAMESAQEALALIAKCVYENPPHSSSEIVEKQVRLEFWECSF